jgi:hypothetical protein
MLHIHPKVVSFRPARRLNRLEFRFIEKQQFLAHAAEQNPDWAAPYPAARPNNSLELS